MCRLSAAQGQLAVDLLRVAEQTLARVEHIAEARGRPVVAERPQTLTSTLVAHLGAEAADSLLQRDLAALVGLRNETPPPAHERARRTCGLISRDAKVGRHAEWRDLQLEAVVLRGSTLLRSVRRASVVQLRQEPARLAVVQLAASSVRTGVELSQQPLVREDGEGIARVGDRMASRDRLLATLARLCMHSGRHLLHGVRVTFLQVFAARHAGDVARAKLLAPGGRPQAAALVRGTGITAALARSA